MGVKINFQYALNQIKERTTLTTQYRFLQNCIAF